MSLCFIFRAGVGLVKAIGKAGFERSIAENAA